MGDAPTTHVFMKPIIFLFLALALYITLLALIPSEFYAGSIAEGDTYDYSYLSMEDIQHIRHLDTVNITRPAAFQNTEWFDFTPAANFKMRVTWTSPVHSYPNKIWFEHLTWEFLFFQQFDQMQIENIAVYGHSFLTKEYAIAQWDEEFNASILYPVECDHVTTKVWLMDTNATRNNISQAWDAGALTISMGFGFSDYETKVSSVDILGRLLLFQAPTVYGLTGDMATIVNLILTIPFYAMVGVLIFLVIIAILPF